MRIAPDDPLTLWLKGVYLNGEKIDHLCVLVDDEQGFADVIADPVNGMIPEEEDGSLKIERRYGEIEIVLGPGFVRRKPVAPESHALNHQSGE